MSEKRDKAVKIAKDIKKLGYPVKVLSGNYGHLVDLWRVFITDIPFSVAEDIKRSRAIKEYLKNNPLPCYIEIRYKHRASLKL
jgi:hypothetical protein